MRRIGYLGVVLALCLPARADDAESEARAARAKAASAQQAAARAEEAAVRADRLNRALRAATEEIERVKNDPAAYRRRATIYAALADHEKALLDWDQAVKLAPDNADILDERGSERFIAGRVEDAVVDFDRAVALDPKRAPGHWKRGIAYYYAGRYDDGRKQFELHQTVNPNDVENAAWCFLCGARTQGAAAARKALLPIRGDTRVPMMEIYEMFAGRGGEQQVWSAVAAGEPSTQEKALREFYAHLYLGLYFEALGERDLAAKHIRTAAGEYTNDHYMWHVARVHAQRLKEPAP